MSTTTRFLVGAEVFSAIVWLALAAGVFLGVIQPGALFAEMAALAAAAFAASSAVARIEKR